MAAKGGRKKTADAADNTLSADGSRKQRNCVAQKAYRARQTLYIKELEKKLQSQSIPETERNLRLEESNSLYRNRLLDSYKKLESISISLKVVLESVGSALDIRHSSTKESRDLNRSSEYAAPHYGSQSPDNPEFAPSVPTNPQARWLNDPDGIEDYIPPDLSCVDPAIPDTTLDDINVFQGHFLEQDATEGVENFYGMQKGLLSNITELDINQNLPLTRQAAWHSKGSDIFSCHLPFDMSQMGFSGYKHIIETSNVIFEEHDVRVCATNSPFSDHIRTIEQILRQRLRHSNPLVHRRTSSIQNIVSSMISAFICLAWEPMSPFIAYTKSHIPVTKITASHVHRGPESNSDLEWYYRPTKIQLSIPHPVVIDWVPFPSIRDRLILFHASNPRLDEIICEIADAYACDTDLSRLIQGFGSVTGYLRVRDLLRIISRGGEEISNEAIDTNNDYGLGEDSLFGSRNSNFIASDHSYVSSSGHCDLDSFTAFRSNLLAPSINAIFESSTQALQAFRILGMDKGPGNLRLDPLFFKKHPELYDGRTDFLARGVPIRAPPTDDTTTLSGPKPIDMRILCRYQEMVMSTFEIISAGKGNNAEDLVEVT